MNHSDFDFYLSRSACLQALEGYRQMEKKMEDEKEVILQALDDTDSCWIGTAQRDVKSRMSKFLQQGTFDETYHKIKDMGDCLEESLPQINALLAECESFAEQLQYDNYKEPYKPAEDDQREWNGGILALNYNYVSQISETCDAILEENEQITTSMKKVLHYCADLLDGAEEDLEKLTAASNKVRRIENYKDAFLLYASEVEKLETDMRVRMQAVCYDSAEDIRKLSENKKQELAGQWVNYDNVEVVQAIAEGIFEKDWSEWSEEEIDFIARTWDDAIQNGKTDLIRLYTEELFTEKYTQITHVLGQGRAENPVMTCSYQFKSDEQKIQLIMSHLDPETQGMAYYTLNRLNHMSSDVMAIYGTKDNIQNRATHNIDVTDEDGTIRIKISTSVNSMPGYADEHFDAMISLSDMNDIIDIKQNSIKQLGFSGEEIQWMRMNAFTDTDVKLLDALSHGEYEAAFMCDPTELSEETQIVLTKFANQVIIKAVENQSENIPDQRATDFINAVLHTSPERCGNRGNNTVHDYLDILGDTNLMLLKSEIGLCTPILNDKTPPEELKALQQEWKNLYVLHGLWETLEEATRSEYFHNLDSNYYDGDYTFQIDNLEISDPFADLKFILGVYTQDGDITYHMNKGELFPQEQTQEISINAADNSSEVNLQLSIIKQQELYEKMELEKTEAFFDAAVCCVGFIPGIKETLKGLQSFYKGDIAGLLTNGGELPGPTIGAMMEIFDCMESYYKSIENYKEESEKEKARYIATILGSGVSGTIKKGVAYTNYGIYDPYIIARLNTWSEKGLYGLLRIEECDKEYDKNELNVLMQEVNDDLDAFPNDYIGSEEELRTCLKLLIYGNDFDGDGNIDCEKKIYEMDPAIFMVAVRRIENAKSFMDKDATIKKKLDGQFCVDFLKQ